ncbi:MAG: long-chain-fatty-acid--CoA ligase [Gammaproteobacteria bacterium]|nr:long-chain-fatty-acid--CoA ligase [Gammaproteobacteria bacterium]
MELTQSVHRAIQVNPDGLAIIAGPVRRSWREFHAAVARAAGMLRQLGVGQDSKVAILSMNSERFVECLYAVPWAGGVLLPLNFRLQIAELAYIVDHAEADILLFEEQFRELAGELRARIPRLRHLVVMDGERSALAGVMAYTAAVAAAASLPDERRGGDDVAAIFYTGGTTGVPKGVMLTHDNLFHFIITFMISERVDTTLVHLHVTPMFHLSCIGVLATTAVAGTHVILPKFDPGEALRAIDEHRVTCCLSVPAMFERMLFHPDAGACRLDSLRMLGYAASPMPPRVLEEARRRYPQLRFAQAYGMTEAPGPLYLGPEHHSQEAVDAGLTRAAGRPVATCEVRIVDDAGRDVERGAVGEIVIRGPIVMKGYWKNPALTREVIRDGWLHTGDAGYMDGGGFVYITDRIKDMIISGGENVYSTEVEAIVSRHPAVAQCAVIGIPSEQWGEGVHAIVALHDGATATAADIMAFCHERIAGYKCPRSVEIRTQPLPMNAAGKILKAQLREPHWAGRPRRI